VHNTSAAAGSTTRSASVVGEKTPQHHQGLQYALCFGKLGLVNIDIVE